MSIHSYALPFLATFFSLGFVFGVSGEANAQSAPSELVARGQYVFALAGGCACHSEPKGIANAGGRAFPIPFGTLYSTNITQDKESGLGNWTDKQIRDALVAGRRPDGSRIVPVMPYEAYSGMAEDDLSALIAYLRTLKPVKKTTPALKSWMPLTRAVAIPLWLKIFGQFSAPASGEKKTGTERGRYLLEHVSLCGDCHTPRNFIGVPNRKLYLAGTDKKNSPLGEAVANITSDKETGIGEWKREDIAELLLTGTKPDLDNVQGLMSEVIEQGFKRMSKEDTLAIADYLKSVPPIKHKVE
jgi:mono/diheme cytochrome c family protein